MKESNPNPNPNSELSSNLKLSSNHLTALFTPSERSQTAKPDTPLKAITSLTEAFRRVHSITLGPVVASIIFKRLESAGLTPADPRYLVEAKTHYDVLEAKRGAGPAGPDSVIAPAAPATTSPPETPSMPTAESSLKLNPTLTVASIPISPPAFGTAPPPKHSAEIRAIGTPTTQEDFVTLRLNKLYALIHDGKDSMKVWQKEHKSWLTIAGFHASHIEKHEGKPESKIWMENKFRETYRGGIGLYPEEQVPKGVYNLWQGFRRVPKQGNYELYKQFVFEVICNGEQYKFDYVWKWLAFLVQYPFKKHKVALLLFSDPGAGKGLFVRPFQEIFGHPFFFKMDGLKQVSSQFNKQIEHSLLVNLNEVSLNVLEDPGQLKAFYTDDFISIEGKGRDQVQRRSYHSLILSTNRPDAIPIEKKDRRNLVLQLANHLLGNRALADAIVGQLDTGGTEALLYDLLQVDLTDYDPAEKPWTPETTELMDHAFTAVDYCLMHMAKVGKNVLLLEDNGEAEHPSPNMLYKHLPPSAQKWERILTREAFLSQLEGCYYKFIVRGTRSSVTQRSLWKRLRTYLWSMSREGIKVPYKRYVSKRAKENAWVSTTMPEDNFLIQYKQGVVVPGEPKTPDKFIFPSPEEFRANLLHALGIDEFPDE